MPIRSLLLLLTLLPTLAFASPKPRAAFHSHSAQEYDMELRAIYDTKIPAPGFRKFTAEQKEEHQYQVEAALKYIIGPATIRKIGGPGKVSSVIVDWNNPFEKNGRIYVNYTYRGKYSVNKKHAGPVSLPIPFHKDDLNTPNWKKCSDSPNDPKLIIGFLWYHWDLNREGCDQQEGVHYQIVNLALSNPTPQTKETYPEYQRMIRDTPSGKELSMTFAFGYHGPSPANSNPETDKDIGAMGFREFAKFLDQFLLPKNFQKTPIFREEYNFKADDKHLVGYQWTGKKNGLNVQIKLVVESGIPQLPLFAKSFAQDHDGFFGWFGHSMLGGGFDNNRLKSYMNNHRDIFSLTPQYQLIYWDSCNSYSYYASQVFEAKQLADRTDTFGTKGADVISNVLPSYFGRTVPHAKTLFTAIWDGNESFQTITDKLKPYSEYSPDSLVVVMGDEDNP